jgi:oleate hydratase
VLLIRDADMHGSRIRILEEAALPGGALDATGNAAQGYVTRGGRMFTDETYTCLWNVLDSIPSLTTPSRSVREEVRAFNLELRSDARARLIDRHHRILDASDLGFDLQDRLEVMLLLATPERALGARRIAECFSPHFLETNFWTMWRTTFAFQNWHSAIELKRYMLRFLQELPRIHTLGGVRRTELNQYDTIVRPMVRWLLAHGVQFEYGTRVVDVEFAESGDGLKLQALRCMRAGQTSVVRLSQDECALLTLGSMTADSRNGNDHQAPELVRDQRDGAWTLWKNLARKAPGLGRPEVFCGNVEETKWESFTLTMRSALLMQRIQAFSGNAPGTGGLMTFKDSSWLMSIVVPHPPHFDAQPGSVYTLWGYGLLLETQGNFINQTLAQASGQEILSELIHHLGFEDILDEVRRTTTVVPVMMPYITSEFQRRTFTDRPSVIPPGAKNFALLGQYVEIPDDVVFTVEYSVRGAMHGVYGLMDLKIDVPPIYHGISDPKIALASLRTLVH